MALTYLQSHSILGEDKPIDPASLAGTIRIIPIVNMPGYRRRSRYMTDGRDLNRFFPGKEDSMYGILNVLRSLKVIPGYSSRPRFRLLASGSVWIRSDHGGLIDVLTPAGSWVEENELVATVSDPEHPGVSMEIRSPTEGLLICIATHLILPRLNLHSQLHLLQ